MGIFADNDEKIADKNACKIEHVIDKELVDKISILTDKCSRENLQMESLNA